MSDRKKYLNVINTVVDSKFNKIIIYNIYKNIYLDKINYINILIKIIKIDMIFLMKIFYMFKLMIYLKLCETK